MSSQEFTLKLPSAIKGPVDVSLIPGASFWAKLEQDPDTGAVTSWHSLIGHCADVSACAYVLLTETVLARRLATLMGRASLTPSLVHKLCLLVAIHDAGKVNHGFQDRARYPERRGGHVSPIINLLDYCDEERPAIMALFDALDIGQIYGWGDHPSNPDDLETFLAELLLISWGHHGRPVGIASLVEWTHWEPRPGGRDPFLGMTRLREAASDWFPSAFDRKTELATLSCVARHAFNGLITLADWLGSDRHVFPFDQGQAERAPASYYQDTLQRARAHALAMGLIPTPSRDALTARLAPLAPSFSTISTRPQPRPLQQVCQTLPLSSLGSTIVLESDTGSGKTEAALIHFMRLFHAEQVDSLYFALPTRTAATQLHARLVEALTVAFPDDDERPPVILAVPGYLNVDGNSGRLLPGFEVQWSDDQKGELTPAERARRWAGEGAKRFLSGAVVVGTIDQALLSCVQVNHAHMRATALLRSLLVIDEVHASDAYMTHLTCAVLQHHCKESQGHAFLMSATLGSHARHGLLEAAGLTQEPPPSYAQASVIPYPLLVHGEPAGPPEERSFAGTGYDKEIGVTLSPWMNIEEGLTSLIDAVIAQALAGARVLILRNTVAGCLATQRALEIELERRREAGERAPTLMHTAKGHLVPHHSRYARVDRELLDESIETTFGKESTLTGIIAVATQTVQQSLDLDADVMWTDLCPMDVLLQRVGRVHRHPERSRLPGFERALLHVLVPEERDALATCIQPKGKGFLPHGLGTVYEDLRILEATWQQLEAHATLRIPEQNRALVEATTHPEELERIATTSLGERGLTHQDYIIAQGFAAGSVAETALLRRDRLFAESSFPRDLARRITTRLGEEDRRVIFEHPLRSFSGRSVRELTLPAHLSRGIAKDAEPVVTSHDTTQFTFALDTAIYRYDRLGLHKLEHTEREDDEVSDA